MSIKLPFDPMLAELVAPPTQNDKGEWKYPPLASDPNMAFEFKWDGHRIIAYRAVTGVTLWARSGRVVTDEYPEIEQAVRTLPPGTVVDGEVVALVNGKSNLQALANRRRVAATLRYMIFDIVVEDGRDVSTEPLIDRKKRLDALLGIRDANSVLQVSKHITDIGIMWPLVVQYELEGVIAKPLNAPYKFGERGTWSKLKLLSRSNFEVAGFTDGTGSRADTIGALILAEPIPFSKELRYAGKCGTGFSGTQAAQLLAAMKPLLTVGTGSILPATQIALAQASSPGTNIWWLQKGLTVEVEYAERSNEDIVRFPSFKGVVSYTAPTAPAPATAVATQTRQRARQNGILGFPPAPPAPTGVKVSFPAVGYAASGGVRQPQAGDVYQAPGSTKTYDLVIKGGDKGLYLACPCPAGKFVWKGGSFSPCKHMKYVLAHDLAGNTIVDGIFA